MRCLSKTLIEEKIDSDKIIFIFELARHLNIFGKIMFQVHKIEKPQTNNLSLFKWDNKKWKNYSVKALFKLK